MGSDVRHVRGEAQKELVKKFEVFTSKGRSRWQVCTSTTTTSIFRGKFGSGKL